MHIIFFKEELQQAIGRIDTLSIQIKQYSNLQENIESLNQENLENLNTIAMLKVIIL